MSGKFGIRQGCLSQLTVKISCRICNGQAKEGESPLRQVRQRSERPIASSSITLMQSHHYQTLQESRVLLLICLPKPIFFGLMKVFAWFAGSKTGSLTSS
jgi:hypothetical protein